MLNFAQAAATRFERALHASRMRGVAPRPGRVVGGAEVDGLTVVQVPCLPRGSSHTTC